MTEFEFATIRLEAWRALEGWGHVKPGGGVNPWGWAERCTNADLLAAWAVKAAAAQASEGGGSP